MPERSDQPAAASDASPVVELRRLSKSFGDVVALRGISLRFTRGLVTVVLGPSGSGKSVMLKHIIGLLHPTTGEVWFDGARIDQLREAELAELRVRFGYLFQQGALFDSMSVLENIEFPLWEHGVRSRPERMKRVRRVLSMVGLEQKLHAMPEDLSGGQRKRIALARAIVLEPEVILYDEPTTGLDPINSDVINELILKLQHGLSVTSIVVTHDLALTFKIADRIVIMRDGQVVGEGDPDEIRASTDPFVQRFLEGRASEQELAGVAEDRSGQNEGNAGERLRVAG